LKTVHQNDVCQVLSLSLSGTRDPHFLLSFTLLIVASNRKKRH